MKLLKIEAGLFSYTDTLRNELLKGNKESRIAVAHSVAADLTMRNGISAQFRETFGGMKQLKAMKPEVGQAIHFQVSGGLFVFCLITKQRGFDVPTCAALKSCLVNLRQAMIQLNIDHVVMPKICCGKDKMDWKVVEGIIFDCFMPEANSTTPESLSVHVCQIGKWPNEEVDGGDGEDNKEVGSDKEVTKK